MVLCYNDAVVVAAIGVSWILWAIFAGFCLWVALNSLRTRSLPLRLLGLAPLILLEAGMGVLYYRLTVRAYPELIGGRASLESVVLCTLWSLGVNVAAFYTFVKDQDVSYGWILFVVAAPLLAQFSIESGVPGQVVYWSLGLGIATWVRSLVLIPYRVLGSES